MIKPLQYQSTVASGTVARVEPNIKWFGKYCPLLLLLYKCALYGQGGMFRCLKRQEFWGQWNWQGLYEKGMR